MTGIMGVISYGLGTIVGFFVIGLLMFWFIQDVTQKKHTVLRNYPVIGRLRFFFEQMGEYFRQYFFAGDRDEMPFNRATRAWVYREDGARRRCVSAPFRLGLFRDNKRQALRVLRACIAACQNHGFFARIYPPELNEFDDAVDLEDARGMLPDECKDS